MHVCTKNCYSKNAVSKKTLTDLQFLRRETHLQQRSTYKTAHVRTSSSKNSQKTRYKRKTRTDRPAF